MMLIKYLLFAVALPYALSQESTPSTAPPTSDSDATPSHSPNGHPGANLPDVDTTEIEVSDCNLTIGYYMDPEDDHFRLPDFSERIGMKNIPCVKDDGNLENCTYDPNTCDVRLIFDTSILIHLQFNTTTIYSTHA